MAYQSAKTFFQRRLVPDAVFAVSDVLAAAAIKAAASCGFSVPQDVMVVGFDNVDISMTTTPTITTIEQPKFDLGYHAVEILVEQITRRNNPMKNRVLSTELIIRESSPPAPGAKYPEELT
jgi:LacI family repressor for deo operon, udp, cdd, tsx, nupC, and nupG